MKNHAPQLSKLLSNAKCFHDDPESHFPKKLKELQVRMLHIQQGIWHCRKRAIILFEGFDAAGKGGTIRRLVERLDPRGYRVHAVGPPDAEDQAKHYLYRFWKNLPAPGTVAIFDRSWYGRVLVERVEKLVPKHRWQAAYAEINNFEALLQADGIEIVKIFLAIRPDEQLKRFEDRLHDPYKNWKITEADLQAHKKWDKYVKATDDLLRKTSVSTLPWHLIDADSKPHAQLQALEVVTKALASHEDWMEAKAEKLRQKEKLHDGLKALEKARKRLKKDS